MIAYVSTDDTGHVVCSVVADEYDADDMVRVEVDDDFDWELQADYVLKEDGSLVYDGAWSAKLEEERKAAQRAEKAARQRDKAVSRLMQALGEFLGDEEVYEYDCIVPEWTEGVKRKKGGLVALDGTVYRVIGNVNKNNDERPGEDGGRYYQPVPKPEEPAAFGE